MKLYIGQQAVLPVLESLTLRKSRSEAAATLTAALLLAAADTCIPKLSLKLGDPVRLLDDGGTEVFLGSIQHLERTPERAVFTAYDRGIYLTRNEVTGVYWGTPAEIAGQIAGELDIDAGTVEASGARKLIVPGAGDSAFSVLRQAVGDGYEIAIRGEALHITKSAYTVYPLQPSQVLEVSGTASLLDMVNRCVVIDRYGRQQATAEQADDMAAYGRFQSVLLQSGDDPAGQAGAALRGRQMSGQITVLGHLNYRCGAAVELHRGEWGLDGVYAVTAAEHRWEGGVYTTVMKLEFIRK